MAEYFVKFKEKISRKLALDKISVHAMYGSHGHGIRPQSIGEVKQYYREKGIDVDKLIEEARSSKFQTPDFENLIGTMWTVQGNVAIVDENDEVIFSPSGPGTIAQSSYEAHFEAACTARDRAVTDMSLAALQECLTRGISSIDAFFNEKTYFWNKRNPKQALVDSKENPIRLDQKFDIWLPILSGGNHFDKSTREWSDYKRIKNFRDTQAIHVKAPSHGVTYQEIADYVNSFRFGVALLLGKIHLILKIPVPASIINAYYIPDVEVIIKE